jgi:hypothetical protein
MEDIDQKIINNEYKTIVDNLMIINKMPILNETDKEIISFLYRNG